ncbi:MAG: phosphoribosyl-AMP cyclohydrolase [Chloroflexi bacterium]|nr:phosphoribosyl-AMP cyclohydrolase [Chloroflexota bacterium]|tara:strand:- start:1377 stop:1754 length:378 start_codon:yes stop_codon:yes gene_type:complete
MCEKEINMTSFDPSELTYDERGLIPAILQLEDNGTVIMLGYMNQATMKKTIEIGQAVFWSRSRQEVWHKGATSGDFVNVHSITTDCDRDVVILKVSLVENGICHTGASSCFITESGQDQIVELKA